MSQHRDRVGRFTPIRRATSASTRPRFVAALFGHAPLRR
jgi:hypothetical protein